jgi:hypothetical protein
MIMDATLPLSKRFLGYFRRYWMTPSSIWLRQRGGWVELRREEIAAVKFKYVSNVIVRYYDGRRVTVSLFGFPNFAYDVVCRALRDALQQNQQRRGLWEGAEVLKVYG